MAKYLVIILLFVCSLSFGQGYSNLGNTNPNDTARVLNNWFLPIKGMRLPFYAPPTNDTGILSTRTAGGNVFSYSLQSLAARIGTILGSPGFQNVLSTNSTLTQNNDINLSGFQLRTFNGLWKSDAAQIGTLSLDAKATYNSNLAPFSGRQIPDAAWVLDQVSSSVTAGNGLHKNGNELELGDLTKPTFINGNNNQYVIYGLGANSGFSRPSGLGLSLSTDTTIGIVADTINLVLMKSGLQYNIVPNPDNELTTKNILLPSRSGTWALIEDITESSFDYTVTSTITSLNLPQFSRTVATINYAGMTFNSDYFTQVGTMITFIGLTFYNGQKLTFNLR